MKINSLYKNVWFILSLVFFVSANNTKLYAQWVRTNGPNGGSVISLTYASNNIIAGTGTTGVFVSSNEGSDWEFINNGLTSARVISLTTCGSTVFAGVNSGVYISTDNGITWMQSGNLGQPVHSFAVKGNYIFAGTSNGGAYLSTDNGTTWVQKANGLPLTNYKTINSMAVSGNNIYAGMDAGLFYTSNNGVSWYSLSDHLNDINVNSVAVTGDYLFVGTASGGVSVSTNNGEAWTPVNNGIYDLNIISMGVKGNYVFAATNNGGTYVTDDFGVNWQPINFGLNGNKIQIFLVKENNIFAGGFPGGFFVSTDNGQRWVTKNAGLTNLGINGGVGIIGNNIFAGTSSNGLYFSTDNGNNWNHVDSFAESTVLSFYINGTDIYIGTYSSLYKSSDNGISWMNLTNTSIGWMPVQSIYKNGNSIFIGNNYGIYRTTNDGTNWTDVSNDLFFSSITSITGSGNYIFAGSTGNGVFLSQNNGTNWTKINNGFTISYPHINALVPAGNYIFAGISGGGIFRRELTGGNWVSENNGVVDSVIMTFTTHGTDIFAGSVSHIYRSTDLGANWTISGNFNDQIKAIAVNETDIYAGTLNSGIWRRPLVDFITPVEMISFTGEVENNKINLNWRTGTETNNMGFEIQRRNGETDFVTVAFVKGAGTSGVIQDYFWSEKMSTGKYTYRLKQIDFNGGFKYSNLIEIKINPDKINLAQNYPNPFNPSTTISYSIPQSGNITLKIFDILGKEVSCLINEYKTPGNYNADFKALNLTSGVYIYQLKANGIVLNKKMVLAK